MIPLDLSKAKNFLAQNNISANEIKLIAGDASFRSYYRVPCGDKNLVLMFAPPSHEDIKPFEKIAKFLFENQFSAPQILHRDEENGFLLLEDFGDDTYGRVLKINAENEYPLYEKALDVLLELHKIKAPSDVAPYNNALLFREVMLFIDWYLPLKNKKISQAQISTYKHLWFDLFDLIDKENQVLVLRDYHADNLMILKDRQNYKAVGLLDFQDAVVGAKAYDLVSLLEDARRDLDPKNAEKLLQYYLDKSKLDKSSFMQDYEILSLQRNIKIIGIFARLSIRDGKNNYLDLMPRVLGFIENRLNSNNKNFSQIKNLLKNLL